MRTKMLKGVWQLRCLMLCSVCIFTAVSCGIPISLDEGNKNPGGAADDASTDPSTDKTEDSASSDEKEESTTGEESNKTATEEEGNENEDTVSNEEEASEDNLDQVASETTTVDQQENEEASSPLVACLAYADSPNFPKYEVNKKGVMTFTDFNIQLQRYDSYVKFVSLKVPALKFMFKPDKPASTVKSGDKVFAVGGMNYKDTLATLSDDELVACMMMDFDTTLNLTVERSKKKFLFFGSSTVVVGQQSFKPSDYHRSQ